MNESLVKLAFHLDKCRKKAGQGMGLNWPKGQKNFPEESLIMQAESVTNLCTGLGIKIITLDEPEYPENLRKVPDCPEVLFVKGALLPRDKMAVAVVGTRKPSALGRAVVQEIAGDLARVGITVISGLAYGIDATAHQAALSASGRTIACLGQGVDLVYPKANRGLYDSIPKYGALLSEYLPGTQPRPWHFPERNRLISGMSLGVLVIEAGEKSGALITADWALKHGRPVMAVPGSIKSKVCQGSNRLIQEGAYLVTCAEDVLSFLRKENEYLPEGISEETKSLSLEESLILRCLEQWESVDEICDNVNYIPVFKVISILSSLELKGMVKSLPGGKYIMTTAGYKLSGKKKVGDLE